MYQSLFPRDVFAELERLQREMREAFDLSPNIRGLGRGGFPALNVGGTPQSVEIFAFAPGDRIAMAEYQLAAQAAEQDADAGQRREFEGPCIGQPPLVDAADQQGQPQGAHIVARRRESAQPRRITVQ